MCNPARDFRDDGGTPEWRARRRRCAALRAWWHRTPAQHLMLYALVLSFGLPWAVLVFGLLGAYLITG